MQYYRRKAMTKNHYINELKNLSCRQLDEFCIYWNSGPVNDGTEQKARGDRITDNPDFRSGLMDGVSTFTGTIII